MDFSAFQATTISGGIGEFTPTLEAVNDGPKDVS